MTIITGTTSEDQSGPAGAVAGGVVGAVLGLILIVGITILVVILLQRSRSSKAANLTSKYIHNVLQTIWFVAMDSQDWRG